MIKFYQEIFSVQNKDTHKLVKLFGIKLKFKRKKRNYMLSKLSQDLLVHSHIVDENLKKIESKLNSINDYSDGHLKQLKTVEAKLNSITQNLDRKLHALNELSVVIFEYLSGIEYNNNFVKEREIIFAPERAPIDHYKRYLFAQSLMSQEDDVADIACACGYGSFMLAQKAKNVLGVDISQPVVDFANKVYKTENLKFICQDAQKLSMKETFDKIVSFETIEHIPHPQDFLKAAHKLLKDKGLFICSVPNETTCPHKKSGNNFHYRHYTEAEFQELLKSCGFKLVHFYHQYWEDNCDIKEKLTKQEGRVILGVFQK